MPGVECVNVPVALYHRIEQLARASGKTVDEHAAELMSKALADHASLVTDEGADEKEAALLAEIRADRETLNVPFLTEAELQRMKRWGRE